MSALMVMLLVSLGPIMAIFTETDDEDADETPVVEDQTLTGSTEVDDLLQGAAGDDSLS
jgi:hypothetical protein